MLKVSVALPEKPTYRAHLASYGPLGSYLNSNMTIQTCHHAALCSAVKYLGHFSSSS